MKKLIIAGALVLVGCAHPDFSPEQVKSVLPAADDPLYEGLVVVEDKEWTGEMFDHSDDQWNSTAHLYTPECAEASIAHGKKLADVDFTAQRTYERGDGFLSVMVSRGDNTAMLDEYVEMNAVCFGDGTSQVEEYSDGITYTIPTAKNPTVNVIYGKARGLSVRLQSASLGVDELRAMRDGYVERIEDL